MTRQPGFNAPEIRRASAEISAYQRLLTRRLTEEFGFSFREAVMGPSNLVDLRGEFAASHITGLGVRVPIDRRRLTVFDRLESVLAHEFWCFTRHLVLGEELDANGRLRALSCLLRGAALDGMNETSLEYRLLEAGTVGVHAFRARVGAMPHDQRRFAVRCLAMPLAEAIEREWIDELEADVA